jgi:hypothetical protein
LRRSTSAGPIRLGLQVQDAVDAKADVQFPFLRLDVDVRGAHLHGILEHRLQELHHRRFLGAESRAERAEIHIGLADIALELLREPGDLLRAPVDPVDGLEQQRLAHHRQFDLALQQPADLVVAEQVGRVGHANEVAGTPALEHHGAEAPRLRLGQSPNHVLVEVVELQVDEGDVQLLGNRLADLLVIDEAQLDADAAELAAALLLLLERDAQLILRDRLLCDEHVAEADFFRASHDEAPSRGGAGHYPRIPRAALFGPARCDYHARSLDHARTRPR